MLQFELPNGVRLDISEGHSIADRLSGYDSGAVLWAAAAPLAQWVATEPEPEPESEPEPEQAKHSSTHKTPIVDDGRLCCCGTSNPLAQVKAPPEPEAELTLDIAVELGCGAGLVSLALAAGNLSLRHVIATDGDEGVLERVTVPNFAMNAAVVHASGN